MRGREGRKACQPVVATGFFSAFGAGVIIAILGNLCLDPLVRFLGATETIAPYARDYAAYIFYGAPFMMCSLAMNNLLRFEGLAAYGMVGITSGGLLNIVLDPILIFGLKLGTAGAAIATARFPTGQLHHSAADDQSPCQRHFHQLEKLHSHRRHL